MPGHADKKTGALYNKGAYGKNPVSKMGPYHMESVKQERSNLLHDNPVAKDASGGRPWIAKHFKSTMGSAVKMGHESPNEMGHESPNEMKYGGPQMGHEDSPASAAKPDFPDIDGDGNTSESMKQAAKDKKAGGPQMKYGGPEMGHDSPAEAHCMGPRMEKGSSLRKEFSIEEAKKKMEERKRKEKAKEEAKK
tara:strand:+ start:33 stop:611 length:579 start_codon:yes stop_codon:yes gene_type:complete